ncbi:MAG TPA: hypothetical protein VF303_02525 [Candidatus Nanoarchaeia archaeon]
MSGDLRLMKSTTLDELKKFRGKIEKYLKKKIKQENKGTAIVRTYSGEETWVASASYIPFMSAAILVLRNNNSEFVSFHARQALVILLFVIVALILLPATLKMLAAVVAYVILIYGAYRAIKGQKWYLPVVTELARTIEL